MPTFTYDSIFFSLRRCERELASSHDQLLSAQAAIAEVMKALEPFDKHAGKFDAYPDEWTDSKRLNDTPSNFLTLGDCRKAHDCYWKLLGLDLSLLHQHDAEVRKPLVVALKESHRVLGALTRALDAGALSMNPSTLLTDIRVTFKKLDDALAQCKEKKIL